MENPTSKLEGSYMIHIFPLDGRRHEVATSSRTTCRAVEEAQRNGSRSSRKPRKPKKFSPFCTKRLSLQHPAASCSCLSCYTVSLGGSHHFRPSQKQLLRATQWRGQTGRGKKGLDLSFFRRKNPRLFKLVDEYG